MVMKSNGLNCIYIAATDRSHCYYNICHTHTLMAEAAM